jgi:4-amino-4-deoxy-L-arabinose transferase-like glycosyltransferase
MVLAGIYAVLMLTLALLYHRVGDYNVETDFFWSYVPEAKSLLHGTFIIDGFRGPVYPLFLACAGGLLGDFFHAGIILSVLAAAGTLWLAYQILRTLFRPDIALIGTLLIAVNRTFLQYTYTASTDMVFNLLVTGSLYFLLRDTQRQWRNILLSALTAAGAYLTRYNGVFLLAAIPVIFLFVNPYGIDRKERFKTTGVFLAIFFGLISPWAVYTFVKTGSFFYNLNYLNIAYEMFAKGKMGWDQYWNVEWQKFHSLFQVIFSDPSRFLETVFTNLYSHFISDMELLLLWPLGIVSASGVYVFWKEKATRQQAALLVFGAAFFGILLLVFYGERFSMFLLLPYTALAVRACTWRSLSSWRFWNRVQIGALISWVLIVLTCAEAYDFNRMNINSGPQEIPLIADWFIKNQGKGTEDQIVVSRKPHIAYHLGMKWIPFPYVQSEEELRQQVLTSNGSYLFFSSMEAYMRPQFRALLDPQNAPRWLIPVTYTVSPPAVLYKVVPGAAP